MWHRKYFAPVIAGGVLLSAACGPQGGTDIVLKGQLTYPSDASIPQGSLARISVREAGADAIVTRIVTERYLYAIGQKPVAFELNIPRLLLRDQGEYSLHAEILGNSGRMLWATEKATPLSLAGDSREPSLTLHLSAAR